MITSINDFFEKYCYEEGRKYEVDIFVGQLDYYYHMTSVRRVSDCEFVAEYDLEAWMPGEDKSFKKSEYCNLFGYKGAFSVSGSVGGAIVDYNFLVHEDEHKMDALVAGWMESLKLTEDAFAMLPDDAKQKVYAQLKASGSEHMQLARFGSPVVCCGEDDEYDENMVMEMKSIFLERRFAVRHDDRWVYVWTDHIAEVCVRKDVVNIRMDNGARYDVKKSELLSTFKALEMLYE